ncbi:MAG: DUF2478 domain-containing protein [Acidiphilium sp.]|nr:DUF2478 domain-containing protein [Acidiphilium sp.]MDD4935158.1 DUF2478 domain-containing protein [Acidiphilium sp.]
MSPDRFAFTENLLNLAAVIYHPEDDIDSLLASFAHHLRNDGCRLGGIVQQNWRKDCGPTKLMEVIDLMTDRTIPICQNLGPGSTACKLDEAGLAEAVQAVRQAIADEVDLVIVNKFGKTEAEGRGLRAEIAEAIVAGRPVLTAVSTRVYPAWRAFTGGFGTTLLCDDAVIQDWWHDIARKLDRRRSNFSATMPVAT